MFHIITSLFGVLLVFILFTDVTASKSKVPEIINWRIPNQNEACYIETLFSDVINDNAPIKYYAGKRKSDSRPHEIKTINLGADGTVVWQLCDAVDINLMGMTALAADKNIARVIEKNKLSKVCRLVDMLQLHELPARSVYILISDRHENNIDSYLFNSIEMEEKKDDYEEYQKSYSLTLGAIIS
jgi:hypothetical protein